MTKGKKLVLCGILTALALALSFAERFIPLGLIVPLPGIKLGLANIVTVAAMYFLGALPALAIAVVRCILGAVFGGSVSALAFSLCGAVLSWAAMLAASKIPSLSVYGICILGAGFHNAGQIVAAAFLLGSAVVSYLPYLLCVSVVMGLVTGTVSSGVLKRVRL